MCQLSPDLAACRGARVVRADAARADHLAERSAQGLPAHLEDPGVAACVVALLVSIPTTPPVGCSARRIRARQRGGAK